MQKTKDFQGMRVMIFGEMQNALYMYPSHPSSQGRSYASDDLCAVRGSAAVHLPRPRKHTNPVDVDADLTEYETWHVEDEHPEIVRGTSS